MLVISRLWPSPCPTWVSRHSTRQSSAPQTWITTSSTQSSSIPIGNWIVLFPLFSNSPFLAFCSLFLSEWRNKYFLVCSCPHCKGMRDTMIAAAELLRDTEPRVRLVAVNGRVYHEVIFINFCIWHHLGRRRLHTYPFPTHISPTKYKYSWMSRMEWLGILV